MPKRKMLLIKLPTLRKSRMLKLSKANKDLTFKKFLMPESNSMTKEFKNSIKRDLNTQRKSEMNHRKTTIKSTLNSNQSLNKWHMPKKEDSIGVKKASRLLMMNFGLKICHFTFNLRLTQRLKLSQRKNTEWLKNQERKPTQRMVLKKRKIQMLKRLMIKKKREKRKKMMLRKRLKQQRKMPK